MKNLFFRRKTILGFACVSLLTASCSDVVVKVEKKPRNHDFSAVNSVDGLNLASSEDFLKQLDDLRVVAADLVIRKLAERDYRSLFRDAVRKYRSFLIAKASGPAKLDDSFYRVTDDKCVERKLSFNMNEANEFLGMILQTAVLAKVSEVSAGNLNAGLEKEIAAIAQLIKIELGVEIDGQTTVTKEGDLTTTAGEFTMKLVAIDGEAIDDATKDADASEVLSVKFERAIADDYIGTFSASLGISSKNAQGELVNYAGTMDVERRKVDAKFVHSIGFQLGPDGTAANYARKLTFEQVNESDKQLKITDTINPGLTSEKSYVTLIDLEKGTLCRINGNGSINDGSNGVKDDDIGDESGFQPGGDDAGSDDAGSADGTSDGGDTAGSSDDGAGGDDASDTTGGTTGGDTDGGTTGGDTDGGTSGGTTGGATGGTDAGSGDGKGDYDDEEPSDDGIQKPGNNPGQHPGQTPGQSPTQKSIK